MALDGTEVTLQIRESATGHRTDLSLREFQDGTCTTCTDDGAFCLDMAPLMDWEDLPW